MSPRATAGSNFRIGRWRACLRQFGSFALVIPPRIEDATVETRLLLRPRELVPIGDVVRRLVPVRHPVMTGPEHAVERAGRNRQAPRGLLAARMRSISASTAGSAMPARLSEPSILAAAEPK